jgi:hypothetical protein
MGNGKHGKEMNDNRAEVYRGDPASKSTCKIGKSLVTLKDRAKLNKRLFEKGMENLEPGEDMNETLAEVDQENPASEGAGGKTGKSSVTLKDRAEMNVRLSKQGPETITLPTQWRLEE